MRTLVDRLFRRGPHPDPNELQGFERAVFSALTREYLPNVGFLSLRLQLSEWIRVGSVHSLGGVPDWWRRRRAGCGFLMTQQRIVGGVFSLPREVCPQQLDFVLTGRARSDCVHIRFRVAEAVESVHLTIQGAPQHGYRYPAADQYDVESPELGDDREYWHSIRAGGNRLERILEGVLEFLDKRDISDHDQVVLPARSDNATPVVAGVTVSGPYRELLRLANGIRVNEILIWGDSGAQERRVAIGSDEYLLIGDDGCDLLALEVRAGTCCDSVVTLSGGSARCLNLDVLQLCLQALERPIAR